MHPDKAPGPDGMTPGFFQKYWGTIKADIIHLVHNFFSSGLIPSGLNHTNVVLIPKKINPVVLGDFRPISLCNVLYKVIAKVLANRLKHVLPHVVSISQGAFLPGRLITDNIIVSFEIMHYLKRRSKGKQGFMAVKLDVSKAYDRLEWGYLRAVMLRMGFDGRWVNLIMTCVESVTYSFIHGSKEFGHLVPGRGLRQGDLISPYLFLLCSEGFSSLIRQFEQSGLIHGCQIARQAPKISHLLFADDSYIYCRANMPEANNLLSLLQRYESISGQKINLDKSSIFFSSNTPVDMRDSICGLMEIFEADEHTTYLGLPNLLGRHKSVLLGFLKDRLRKKILIDPH